MLEIKNLTKIYNTKGAGYVLAIDNLSLAFGDTGMVFLLGKSGSGKSTLLNLIGGLDRPNSGEIIIKGRGSGAFTASDFDSYRNTCVGFIFQEYNVLDEFTVEDNISLALELQGKPKDRTKIDEILRLVELENYGKRKPNTLSGGQKQRVAIARALVKDPEIIMADEPTGALDSETGRQVLDTLKNLSKNKLVIVVSHDREFAEKYGDRIIELKDGKVVSDLSRCQGDGAEEQQNIVFKENNTIDIVSGAELSDGDLEKIRQFVRSTGEGVTISAVSAAQSVSGFEKTDNGKFKCRMYSAEDSTFIRSRLPVRHSVKIGASTMRIKPVRLFFTIFLTFIAFTMFGLFSTLMLFNEQQTMVNSLAQSDLPYVLAEKQYQYMRMYEDEDINDYTNVMTGNALFTQEEAEHIWRNIDDQALFAINNGTRRIGNLNLYNTNADTTRYTNTVRSFVVSSPQSVFRTSQKILWGSYPEEDDEIMISSYLFECIKNGVLEVEKDGKAMQLTITEYSQLEDVQLRFDHNYGSAGLTVCGVFDCGEIPENGTTGENGRLFPIFNDAYFINSVKYSEGLYPVCFVSDSFYDANEWLIYAEYISDYFGEFYNVDNVKLISEQSEINVNVVAEYNDPYLGRQKYLSYGFDGEIIASLADDELVVSSGQLATLISHELTALSEGENAEEYSAALREWTQPDEEGLSLVDKNNLFGFGCYMQGEDKVNADRAVRLAYYGEIIAFLQSYDIDPFTLTMRVENYSGSRDYDVKIVGCYMTAEKSSVVNMEDYCIYCGDGAFRGATDVKIMYGYEIKSNYSRDGEKYTYAYLTNESAVVGAVSDRVFGSPQEDDSFYRFGNSVCIFIEGFTIIAEILSKVFLWVGVILAIFSMLLLFNFISVSIVNKKREIGILRALGARSVDVFKIFFAETVIITLVSLVLSICCSLILCALFNGMISTEIGIPFALFVFGPLSFLLVVAVAVVSSFIATSLPVYSIAKKRPVDSIREL